MSGRTTDGDSAGASQDAPLPRGLRLSDLLSISDETDETGRLLLEDSAPPAAVRKAVRAGVAMASARCSYDDSRSRQGKAMNVSAYEALRHDTRELLDGFAWLAQEYAAAGLGERATVQGLADVTKLGVTLPLVLFHRARHPIRRQRALPTFAASLFKASRGMFSAAFDMAARAAAAPTTPEDVVAFAETHGHLARRETGRACAAPTRLIERTLAVLLTGEGGDASASRLGELVAFDMLAEFFLLERGFSASLNRYAAVLQQVGPRAADPRALFDAPVRVGGDVVRFGAVTESFLEYANETQLALNRVLGRAPNPPRLVFQDVLSAL